MPLQRVDSVGDASVGETWKETYEEQTGRKPPCCEHIKLAQMVYFCQQQEEHLPYSHLHQTQFFLLSWRNENHLYIKWLNLDNYLFVKDYDSYYDEEVAAFAEVHGWCEACTEGRHSVCEGIIQLDTMGNGKMCGCGEEKCGLRSPSVRNL